MSESDATPGGETPGAIFCLFCDKLDNLIADPEPFTYLAVKQVAHERQDAVRDKFLRLYQEALTKQRFSWHHTCVITYICHKYIHAQAAAASGALQQEMKDIQTTSDDPERLKDCFFCESTLRPDQLKFDSPQDFLDKGIRYHKGCYLDYVRLPKCCVTKPPEVPDSIMFKALAQLLEEIDSKLPKCCMALSYLARRLQALTGMRTADVDTECVTGLLTARYGERIMFSYPAGLNSCVVFLSRVPLSQAMRRLR
ncbi:unnamed protein product [Spodoptera littoralis]|uniref:Uncharacterized protein n=1 Tax=Spodoptera littoralis TaxID=7109 RepID=A0A9P0N7W6_SPOLI|nr:unnamed protein product [Spodoptera littoralis]CAH1645679.1 unnamed protein product [Spodoptera littoralis]